MNTASTGPEARVRSRLGMRLWLALAFGALAGTLCIVLSFAVGERAREVARMEAGRYLARAAAEYRNRIEQTLAERLADLHLAARLDRSGAEALLRERGFVWVGTIDAAGRVQTAYGTRATRVGLPQRLLVDLQVPLQAGPGVVAGQLDLAWAHRLRVALEAAADPALAVELVLLAADGTVLIGPAALDGGKLMLPASAASLSSGTEHRWPDGERYLIAASAAGEAAVPGWSTLARTRADAAFASADAQQRAVVWAALVLTLAGVGAGWVFATRHARPLEQLTRAAQEIASGNDRAELPPLDDNREVTRLAEALRAMVARLRAQSESLRDAQDRLQRRVHERTAELVKVQAELELEVAEAKLAQEQLAQALAESRRKIEH